VSASAVLLCVQVALPTRSFQAKKVLLLKHKQEKMRKAQDIRNDIIDKILGIQNESALLELDQYISASHAVSDTIFVSLEQRRLLEMSDNDIKDGRIISQEELVAKKLEWLNAL
jgi:hypothetical protein